MAQGVRGLSKIAVGQILKENPTISTLEELCAFWGINIEEIPEDLKKYTTMRINRNITKLRVKLKNEMLAAHEFKQHEMLYKLIASDDEIKRLKAGEKTQVVNNNNMKPTIQVKSDDPDILNKLTEL